jgi:hypothetical protein
VATLGCATCAQARYWKHYVEEEMQANNFDRVEKLFMRCLLKCLDMDLWKTYIRYIKLVKAGQSDENRALGRSLSPV